MTPPAGARLRLGPRWAFLGVVRGAGGSGCGFWRGSRLRPRRPRLPRFRSREPRLPGQDPDQFDPVRRGHTPPNSNQVRDCTRTPAPHSPLRSATRSPTPESQDPDQFDPLRPGHTPPNSNQVRDCTGTPAQHSPDRPARHSPTPEPHDPDQFDPLKQRYTGSNSNFVRENPGSPTPHTPPAHTTPHTTAPGRTRRCDPALCGQPKGAGARRPTPTRWSPAAST